MKKKIQAHVNLTRKLINICDNLFLIF